MEDLQCNHFIQPLHSNLYIRCIHKKMTMLILCYAIPQQLQPEPKNGLAYKIENVNFVR